MTDTLQNWRHRRDTAERVLKFAEDKMVNRQLSELHNQLQEMTGITEKGVTFFSIEEGGNPCAVARVEVPDSTDLLQFKETEITHLCLDFVQQRLELKASPQVSLVCSHTYQATREEKKALREGGTVRGMKYIRIRNKLVRA